MLNLSKQHLKAANELIQYYESVYDPEVDGDYDEYMKRSIIGWIKHCNQLIEEKENE